MKNTILTDILFGKKINNFLKYQRRINMDSDGVYRRVNINKVMEQILKNNPNLTESKAQELALIMIKELNKKLSSAVADFENGEGDFMSCYFEAIEKINIVK